VTLFADIMPFASQRMQNFAVMRGFEIITSSPDFPQSDEQAKRSVQIMKTLL